MFLSGAIWLSTNSSRVCDLALGKSFSDFSSAAEFCGVSPPCIFRNVKRFSGFG